MRTNTTDRSTRRTLLLLVAAVAPFAVAAAPATDDGVRVFDLSSERRLVLTLGEPAQRTVEGPAGAPVIVRMPRAAILHHFRGELVDAEGKRVVRRPDWSVTFLGATHDALAQLTSAKAVVDLPRPYGVEVAEGDSMVVVAQVPNGLDGAVLRLTIEYELPDERPTRLPVRLLGAVMEATSWTWRPQVDGRLVAISSPALAGAVNVVLEDVESGEELWRGPARGRAGAFVVGAGESIRVMARVEGGRAYRLRIVGPYFEPPTTTPPVAIAFLLPES